MAQYSIFALMKYVLGFDLLAHDVDGIHIFTMNNPKVAKRIYEGIKTLL